MNYRLAGRQVAFVKLAAGDDLIDLEPGETSKITAEMRPEEIRNIIQAYKDEQKYLEDTTTERAPTVGKWGRIGTTAGSAAGGAGLGALIGKATGHPGIGALIGAGLGAAGGEGITGYRNKKMREPIMADLLTRMPGRFSERALPGLELPTRVAMTKSLQNTADKATARVKGDWLRKALKRDDEKE